MTALLTVTVLLLGTATAHLADRRLLETAAEAARWIDASAVRSPRGVVWPADPADPKSVATNLYAGAAGMATLLLRLDAAERKRPTAFRLPDCPFPR